MLTQANWHELVLLDWHSSISDRINKYTRVTIETESWKKEEGTKCKSLLPRPPFINQGFQLSDESKITKAFVSHLHTLGDLKLGSSAPSDSVLG